MRVSLIIASLLGIALAAPVSKKISPKVMLVTGFTPEADVWTPFNFTEQYPVVGFMPEYENVTCTASGDICSMTMGQAELGDSLAIAALWLSPDFDLSKTYFIVNGIVGINPKLATEGGVSVSRYVVEFEMGQSLLGSDLPANFSGLTLFSEFTGDPYKYPDVSGTEVYELNNDLIDRFVNVTKNVTLAEAPKSVQDYRKRYIYKAARHAPEIVRCDTVSAMTYWAGEEWARNVEFFSQLLTNGSAQYCATTQDDTGTMVGLVRGALYNKLDFSRVLVLHGASDFDRPPPDATAYQGLFVEGQSGFDTALVNIYRAGAPFVEDIVANWEKVYKKGIAPSNYVGDILGLLGGKPDFGPKS